MKKHNLSEFTKGWFIGSFTPTIHSTNDFEAAVKYYKLGDYEEEHYHKVATEYTIIAEGKVRMFKQTFVKGDIIEVKPNDRTSFLALENTITFVIKTPCVNGDKYTDQ